MTDPQEPWWLQQLRLAKGTKTYREIASATVGTLKYDRIGPIFAGKVGGTRRDLVTIAAVLVPDDVLRAQIIADYDAQIVNKYGPGEMKKLIVHGDQNRVDAVTEALSTEWQPTPDADRPTLRELPRFPEPAPDAAIRELTAAIRDLITELKTQKP